MNATIRPTTVFQPCYSLTQLPATLQLRDVEWSVFLSCDGHRTVGQLQRMLVMEEAIFIGVCQRLLDLRLVNERPLTLEEHARAVALHSLPRDQKPRPLREFLQPAQAVETVEGHDLNGESLALAEPATAEPHPTPLASAATRQNEPSPAAAVAAPRTPRPFTPLPKPQARPTTSMSLRAVIQHILHHASDPTEGQLAVYRVFMGIDTRLLKRNGIQSLRFQDDRVITDPELQNAISQSLTKNLRISLPETVYVN